MITRPVFPSWRKETPTQMRVIVKQKQKILTSLMTLHKLKTCCKYWQAKPRIPLDMDMLSCFILLCNSRRPAISRDPLPMKFYFDFKWLVFSDAVQIWNILEAESMNTAEDKNELGHRNFNRSGFLFNLLSSYSFSFFSFRLFCSTKFRFVLWKGAMTWDACIHPPLHICLQDALRLYTLET